MSHFSQKYSTTIMLISLLSFALEPLVAFSDINNEKITITSKNLESELFSKNPDLVHELNAVAKARDQLNITRGELLPSLNINAVFSQASPTFMLSSVSCLVPFLFPSKWFDLKTSKKSYNSEKLGLQLTRLNIFATAYTLINRIEGDIKTYEMSLEQNKRFNEDLVQLKARLDVGLIPIEDYKVAEMEARQRESDLSKMRQLVDAERSTIRKLFGYSLNTDFELSLEDIQPSDYESADPVSVIDHIVSISPENTQLTLLAEAAKSSVKSTQWSFLVGCGGGSQGSIGAGGSNAFNLSTAVTTNLGFGYFPRVKLAKHNAYEIELRKSDLTLELGRLLEVTTSAIRETKLRLETNEANVKDAELILSKSKQKYAQGVANIMSVIHNYSIVTKAKMDLIGTSNELTGHRITMQRLAMEGQFAKIYSENAN